MRRSLLMQSKAMILLGVLGGCSSNSSQSPVDAASPTADLANPTPDAGTDGPMGPTGFSILHSFDGETGSVSDYRGKPEMNIAANGTQVAQISSPSLDVFDYNGNQLRRTLLSTLVTNAGLNPTTPTGGAPYEPHIIFDEFIQRWVISMTCSLDCILVSSGPDAVTSTWKGFYLDNYGNDPAIHMGYDRNGVYFAEGNMPGNPDTTSTYGAVVFAIPSAELSWTSTLAPAHKNKLAGKPLDVMTVIDQNPNKASNAPALFISRTCNGTTNCQGNPGALIVNDAFQWVVTYGVWSGTTFAWTSNHTSRCAGGTAPTDQCVRTDPNGSSDRWLYNTPIDPPQPGTNIPLRGAEIHRILGAIQQGNHIHVALGSGPCTSNCGAHGIDTNDIFIWSDIDCSTVGACKVYQTQKASTQDHLLWPAVGADPAGNVAIFANAVNGTTTELNIQAWSHQASDSPGVLSAPTVITSGTSAYLCSTNPTTSQTGNPAGISTVHDPLDLTALWITEQYARSSGDCQWNTRVIEYRP